MPDQISSQSAHTSAAPVERPDSQPAQNHAASEGRRSRTRGAGSALGGGGASPLTKRPNGAAPATQLRRTLSRSDLTDRVAAFSRRFHADQQPQPTARLNGTRERDVDERPAARPLPGAQSEPARQPVQDTHLHETDSRTASPFPAPYLGPHLAPVYTSVYTPSYHAPYQPHLADVYQVPYHAPYHWRAQHTYPASDLAFCAHGYAPYAQQLAWHAPLPGWLAPTYQSRVVGANSRIGFTYGFGDGPTGKQMHVGFHFNGRFRTLRFGLYPSATRPLFVETHSGRMQAAPAPAWPFAMPGHPAAPAYRPPAALPCVGAIGAGRAWHAVLGMREDDATVDTVRLQYRRKRQHLLANPSANRFALVELHVAYQNALDALSQRAASEPDEATNRA